MQSAYTVDRSMVYLNSGGVSPAPSVVQEALGRYLSEAHGSPSYTMWRLQAPRKESVRRHLARNFGVDGEELAITRNASEGLQICQFGFDLHAGDEVLTSQQAYPRMRTTFRQRERREGIKLRLVTLPVPAVDEDEIVRRFAAQITDRTRLMLVSHIINITGQVLPVRKLVELGRKRGIPVIVDGAHSYGHLVFKREDLGCDYFATSLHKWMCAPFGTGLLYVRKSCIEGLWPLMGASQSSVSNIRKFEEIGTHPLANILAISDALRFHEAITAERKAAGLVYLRDRWARRLLQNDRVSLHTSLEPGQAGAIATLKVEGLDPFQLQRHLWSVHQIYTIAIGFEHDERGADGAPPVNFEGLRVSPNVFTTPEEIDRFAHAVEKVLIKGLPG